VRERHESPPTQAWPETEVQEHVEQTADRKRHWYKYIEEWVTLQYRALSAVFMLSVVTAVETCPVIVVPWKTQELFL
jgi:hypothetical protein